MSGGNGSPAARGITWRKYLFSVTQVPLEGHFVPVVKLVVPVFPPPPAVNSWLEFSSCGIPVLLQVGISLTGFPFEKR
jgi:hypothetical protein